MTVVAHNLGFPRIGRHRELKKALEAYWAGTIDGAALEATAAELRAHNWQLQHDRGLDHIPCGDFSLYDHVLDTAYMVGVVPDRYRTESEEVGLDAYFAMARGGTLAGRDVQAMEMTKWFDTNYHYLVPELHADQRFTLHPYKLLGEISQAKAMGLVPRPVVLGPVSFLYLAKHTSYAPLAELPNLVEVYATLFQHLAATGVEWVQVDEPVLGLDLNQESRDALASSYRTMREAAGLLRLLVATYFSGLRANMQTALALPIDAIHLDAVTEPDQVHAAAEQAPEHLALSIGIVDGRNVWRTDLGRALFHLEAVRNQVGSDRLMVGPSCSLMHLPFDVGLETSLDPELRSWLAFATQRLDEITALAAALNGNHDAASAAFDASMHTLRSRAQSPRVHDPAVQQRLADDHPGLNQRRSTYQRRQPAQAAKLMLPPLPTTTIGSFPQTNEVRSLRARHAKGEVDEVAYRNGMHDIIRDTIATQQDLGLDVLVHGEPERNDMVEYFGGLLDGCAVTTNGWVQSYGSRCVKPPLIYGDVRRHAPMTVEWATYAQSLTDRPVKGMLTGPVTILCWSFVRDDQPLERTCRQLGFAIRDEVADLEAAGIGVIQIDEPALREGLPLHVEDREAYLAWSVAAFRLASSGVADETQIHTHMCYGEFNDIITSIAAFDADVISIEASRSGMELLAAFSDFDYPNEIGPGLYDIHSPRIPPIEEMADLLREAMQVIPFQQLWANPDCGLKTRSWDEVRLALRNMVAAAAQVRAEPGS